MLTADLYVYMCYWQDLRWLKKSLPLVSPHVTKVIVHDGRFSEFPGVHVYSNDGVIAYCAQFNNVEYVSSHYPYETQMVKRNWMFRLVPKGEWIMVLDADEAVVKPRLLRSFSPPTDAHVGAALIIEKMPDIAKEMAKFGYTGDDLKIWHRRFFKNEGLSYGDAHYKVLKDGEPFVGSGHMGFADWLEKCAILHWRQWRFEGRMKDKKEYFVNRAEPRHDSVLPGMSRLATREEVWEFIK